MPVATKIQRPAGSLAYMKPMSKSAFKKLSKTARRRLVMKDVILHIRMKHITADPGTLIGFHPPSDENDTSGPIHHLDEDLDVTTKVAQKEIFKSTCCVCARGAMIYAAIMRTDDCNVEGLIAAHDEEERLEKNDLDLFERNERKIIERAFEGFGYESSIFNSYEQYEAGLYNFFYRFKDPGERLTAIALNIIEHGTFDASKPVSRLRVQKALAFHKVKPRKRAPLRTPRLFQ